MNIKNQIRLSVLISLILVAVISASIIVSFQNMQDLRVQEALAADVVRGSYELTYLSNDYLINAEPRARLQWEERYTSLQPIISELKPGNVAEEKSLEMIREYNENTGTLFRVIPEPGTLGAGTVLFPASYQQITWSRINVQSQGMIYEAWRLRHLYNDDVSEARFWNNVLVVILMVLMLIIIGVNYLLISRRLVRSIREVDAGSRAFAAGNLDYRIPLMGTDEIGNIGAGLNAMAASLKTITASRDELDLEVDQRRRAEEALVSKNTELEAAFMEITANEEELKANFDELVHSQRSLAESERKYRNLYQYAQVGLFETSFKDATVIACNQRYATLAGFSSIEEAIGKDIVHLYVNADDRTEVGRILREHGSIENHTVQLRNQSTGKIFWGQFSARFNYERDVAEGSIIDVTAQKESETRLQESEERYRVILETMQDAYFRADSEGMITMVNPAAAVMYGYQSAEEMIGMPVVSLYANRNDRDAMFRQLDDSGRISDYSGMGRRKDGSHFWVSINVRVTFDSAGKIQASEGFVRDITARKQTEAALEVRTRFFDTMFESLAVSTWISDEKGTAIRANPACLKFFGATQEEVIGKYNIFRDSVIEKNGLMPEIIKVFAKGQPVSITIDYDFGAVDHVHVRDATNKFITSVFTPIVTKEGNVTNVVVQSIDLTDIRMAEERLKESERAISDIVDKLNKTQHITLIGSWEWNLVANQVWWSDETYRIFGVTPQDFVPGFDENSRFIHPDDLEEYNTSFEHSFQTGEPLDVELRLVTREGVQKYCHAQGKIIYDDAGKPSRFIGTMSDITVRKRAEAELAAAQQQYRDLFDSVSIGILRSTPRPEGTIIEVNPAAIRIFEADSREQLLAVRPGDLYLDHDERRRISEEIVAKGTITGREVRYKTLKGRVFWGNITSSKKISDDGQVYFDNTIEDITDRKRAEEQLLLKDNAFVSSIAANSIADIRGIITHVNPAFLKLWGYPAEEDAIGHSVSSFFAHEEDGQPVLVALDTLGRWEGEFLAKRTDGSTFFTQGIATIIRDAKGDPIGYQSTNLDITDRKRAEEALRASEAHLLAILDATPFPIALVDVSDNKIHFWSRSALTLFGHTAPTAAEWFEMAYPDPAYRREVLERWKPALEKARLSGQVVNAGEYRVTCRDGSVRTCELYAEFLADRLIVTFNDITDRKRSEEARRESEKRFTELFDTASSGIAIYEVHNDGLSGKDYIIKDFNRAALALEGRKKEEVVGKSLFDLRPAIDDYGLIPIFKEVWKTGNPANYPATMYVDGKYANYYENRVFRLHGGEIVALYDDVTVQKRAEEQVKASEARYRRLFEAAKDGILILNRDSGEIIDANPFIESLLGYAPQDLLGKHLWDIGLFNDQVLSKIAFKDLQTQEYLRYEDLPLETMGGQRIEVEFISNVYPVDPTTSVIQCSIRDITDRKIAEEALKESEREFRTLAESMPQIVWVTRPDGWNTYFNQQWVDYTGLTLEESYGHGWITPFHPDDKKRTSDAWERATHNNEPYSLECRLRRADGAYRWWLIRGVPLRNAQGEILKWFGTCTDIDGIKQAEAALRETTDYLRNLLDYANAPIIVWDPQFRITRFNHAFERLTGRTEKEVAGQHLALLFPVLSRETSLEQIQKTLAGERWEIVEIPILHVSGEVRIVLWNSANIVDPSGAIISTIAQGLDITDRKLSEVQREMLITDLEQKNAELERFTYTVSHDLKSPLITIKGFAGLIEDDARRGDALQLKMDINRITSAADIMQELLADVLELSRIGRVISPPEKIPFGTIAHQAVDLLAGPLAERGVRIEIAPDLPVVHADHIRIREVLVNLIENAVKFLGNQSDPEIRIGANPGGATPVFFVQDNGMGINPLYLDRIFNLFERLDTSSPGTGIGLTIARRIIEVHGGKIWAESEGPGKGTTFRFTLPGPQDKAQ